MIKKHFENLWEEIVTSTNDCLSLLDDGSDDEGELREHITDSLDSLRHKKDRLTWFEEELEGRLAATVDDKNVELDVVDETSPVSLIESLNVVGGGRTDVLQTDSNVKGEAIDKSMLKHEPVVSDVVREEAESENDSLEFDNSALQVIKEGGKSMFDKIGDLFDLKTGILRNDIKAGNASLKSDMNLLKSDNENLRRDFEKSNHALKRDMDDVVVRNR